MLCEPLIIVFIFYEVLVCGCYFPTFLACIVMQNVGFIKNPSNSYAWGCIAAAGNRATIPLENVVSYKYVLNIYN